MLAWRRLCSDLVTEIWPPLGALSAWMMELAGGPMADPERMSFRREGCPSVSSAACGKSAGCGHAALGTALRPAPQFLDNPAGCPHAHSLDYDG